MYDLVTNKVLQEAQLQKGLKVKYMEGETYHLGYRTGKNSIKWQIDSLGRRNQMLQL